MSFWTPVENPGTRPLRSWVFDVGCALLRKTAAGLSAFAAVFFVLPIVTNTLPHNITGFAPYLPSNAGGELWGLSVTSAHALSPWTGFAVLCGYAVVLTAAAAWRLRRRDA